jgi:polar amino acid transport system substrate-binding protein
MDLTSKLFIAPTPHSSYSRHVLVPKNKPELQKIVNEAVADSGWQATLTKYKAK